MLEASPRFDLLSSAEFSCDRCGYTGAVQQPFNGCPDCRETSTLRLLFSPNLQQLRELFQHSDSRKKLAALNPFHDEKWISLGEGHTGLVCSTKIGPELGLSNLYFKNECCNPTGSFKDRYVWLTTNIARMIGYTGVVVSSTGNLGLSTAAHAALAGLKCVFIAGDDTPKSFIADSKRHGAVVITASRSRRFEVFELLSKRSGWFPMGLFMPRRVQNPFGIHAYRSIAYEIVLELGRVPDLVAFPAARGNNLYGTFLGFQSLVAAGIISKVPQMVAAQPALANTIEVSIERGHSHSIRLEGSRSLAISASETEASNYAIDAIRKTRGCGASADESQLRIAIDSLAAEGLIVDPAAALTVATLPSLVGRGLLNRTATCVLVLTGAGTRWNSNNEEPHMVLDDSQVLDNGAVCKLWNEIELHYGH